MVNLETMEISATIDTAASSNFVRKDFLPPGITLEGAPTNIELAVKGQNMQVTGAVLLSLNLQGELFKVRALVSPGLREKLILGLTWLKDEGAVIDLNRRVLMIGQHRRVSAPFAGSPPEALGFSLRNWKAA